MLSTEFLSICNPQWAEETLNSEIVSECVSLIQARPCQGLEGIALPEYWQSYAPYVSKSEGCQSLPGNANVCNWSVCRKSSFLFLFLDLCSLGLRDYRVLPLRFISSTPPSFPPDGLCITNVLPATGVVSGSWHFIRMCTPHPNLTFLYACLCVLALLPQQT